MVSYVERRTASWGGRLEKSVAQRMSERDIDRAGDPMKSQSRAEGEQRTG